MFFYKIILNEIELWNKKRDWILIANTFIMTFLLLNFEPNVRLVKINDLLKIGEEKLMY